MRVVVEDLEKEKKKETEKWENYHSIMWHVNPMDYLAEAETSRAGGGGGAYGTVGGSARWPSEVRRGCTRERAAGDTSV